MNYEVKTITLIKMRCWSKAIKSQLSRLKKLHYLSFVIHTFIISLIIVLGKMNSGLATEAIVQRQALAWETGNVGGIVHDFAPNGIFKAGKYVFEGVEAIQQAAENYFQQFTDTKVTIKRIIIEENQGAVEWNWSDRNIKTGKVSQAEDAIIFELQADGKIIYWREYIEKIVS